MRDVNPNELFNDFKSGKVSKSSLIDSLFTILQNSDNIKVKNRALEILVYNLLPEGVDIIKWVINNEKSVDILCPLYQNLEFLGEDRENLKRYMEETLGKPFMEEHDIVAREAMGLRLLELRAEVELENHDKIPNLHHVHAAFRVKDGHIIDLDIVETSTYKVEFLNLFPNLTRLKLVMASLNEIQGLKDLKELEILDLAVNDLSEINGISHLHKLRKIYLYSNKLTKLTGLESLVELEELYIQENPIKKLKGLSKLKKLKYVELIDTDLSEREKKKIKKLFNKEN